MLKAWRINEFEIYAGESLEEAITAAMQANGLCREDAFDPSFGEEEDPAMTVGNDDNGERTTIGAILASMTAPGLVCGFGEA